MKVYIAGKIGDLPVEEYTKKFNGAHKYLERHGYDVVSPIKLPHAHSRTWAAYMLENLAALSECEGIAMLPNWMDSPGARIEHAFAYRMGLEIFYL